MSAERPLTGRTVLVTGATGGIGLETARRLAALGARLVLGVRDPERGRAVAARIEAEGGAADALPLDLASFASVRAAADRYAAARGALDVLVNNAGVAAATRTVTEDGHERTWQTNFLGGYLLTRLLLPVLRRGTRPRIVHVSSEAHRTGAIDWDNLELERGYGGFRAYANTKLAQIHIMRELARREPGVASNALHPGAIATGIWREVPQPARALVHAALWMIGGGSVARGAAPVARLASDPALEGVTGRYFKRFREAEPSAAARDDATAARLWSVAASQTGLGG
ncbi:MAG TPA: SDR family NAD(P)-dependent oxidoreductase [Thermoanaerobaculia bacterium]|nr:SDR family NAD(P)-dependent oxidoreductase [Thermoanaerobaculia bacterium]